MGKYKILGVEKAFANNKADIENGDIIHLEEIEEVVEKESLEENLALEWKKLLDISKAHYQSHPEELGLVNQDDIKNINKRLGDLEAKAGKASKSDVKALAEYVRNKTEGLVKLEDVLKIIEKAWNSRSCINGNEYNLYLYLRKAIEGMKQ